MHAAFIREHIVELGVAIKKLEAMFFNVVILSILSVIVRITK